MVKPPHRRRALAGVNDPAAIEFWRDFETLSPGAQRDLGRMYALGLGVQRDPAQAYAWYETAALNGDGAASTHRDRLVTQMSPDEIARGERLAKSIAGSASCWEVAKRLLNGAPPTCCCAPARMSSPSAT